MVPAVLGSSGIGSGILSTGSVAFRDAEQARWAKVLSSNLATLNRHMLICLTIPIPTYGIPTLHSSGRKRNEKNSKNLESKKKKKTIK